MTFQLQFTAKIIKAISEYLDGFLSSHETCKQTLLRLEIIVVTVVTIQNGISVCKSIFSLEE